MSDMVLLYAEEIVSISSVVWAQRMTDIQTDNQKVHGTVVTSIALCKIACQRCRLTTSLTPRRSRRQATPLARDSCAGTNSGALCLMSMPLPSEKLTDILIT